MALRVLLADESVTIKKVIQLALQDFAVEVKAVPVGLDVMNVAKSFNPDLVFADILLQKKSGYEVCAELKRDHSTAAIPVVLMWSSFMELDAAQFNSCGADGKLEKPFEVEQLRKLVLELVPRTRSQRLAHFLEFPAGSKKTPPSDPAPAARSTKPPSSPTPAASTSANKSAEPPSAKVATERPLGALPPLDLGPNDAPPTPSATMSSSASAPAASASSQWNVDSFPDPELPVPGLDDEAEDEDFQPMRLPDVEVTPARAQGSNAATAPVDPPPTSTLSPLDDDDEADQWRTASKYQLKPLDLDASINASIQAAADELTGEMSEGLQESSTDDLDQESIRLRSREATQTISSAQSRVIRTETRIPTQPTELEFTPPASHAPTSSSRDTQLGDTKFHNIEFNSQPLDEIELPQTYAGTSDLAPPTNFDEGEEPNEATLRITSPDRAPADTTTVPKKSSSQRSDIVLTAEDPLQMDEISLPSFKEPAALKEPLDPALGSGQIEPLELELDDLTTPTPKLSPLVQEVLRDPFVEKMRDEAEAEATRATKSLDELDQDRLEAIVRRQMEPILKQVIERLVAERVPEIAERLVRQELQRLVEDQA